MPTLPESLQAFVQLLMVGARSAAYVTNSWCVGATLKTVTLQMHKSIFGRVGLCNPSWLLVPLLSLQVRSYVCTTGTRIPAVSSTLHEPVAVLVPLADPMRRGLRHNAGYSLQTQQLSLSAISPRSADSDGVRWDGGTRYIAAHSVAYIRRSCAEFIMLHG